MKKIVKIALFSFLCLCSIGQSFAQTEIEDIKYVDALYLNNGSVFRGKLVEYKHDEYVKIQILGGQVITFPAEQVLKVVQENIHASGPKARLIREYAFKENGIYNETYFNMPMGNDQWGWWVSGLGLHHVMGYQHNRWIGAGLGVGIDAYEIGSSHNVLPIYLEARGYFLKKKVSPFYSMNLGYGIALKDQNSNIVEAKGGLMYNPSLGYRFGGHPNANFTLALGYKVQKASYTRLGWDGSRFENKYTFKRVNLKLGILF